MSTHNHSNDNPQNHLEDQDSEIPQHTPPNQHVEAANQEIGYHQETVGVEDQDSEMPHHHPLNQHVEAAIQGNGYHQETVALEDNPSLSDHETERRSSDDDEEEEGDEGKKITIDDGIMGDLAEAYNQAEYLIELIYDEDDPRNISILRVMIAYRELKLRFPNVQELYEFIKEQVDPLQKCVLPETELRIKLLALQGVFYKIVTEEETLRPDIHNNGRHRELFSLSSELWKLGNERWVRENYPAYASEMAEIHSGTEVPQSSRAQDSEYHDKTKTALALALMPK